MSDDDDNDNLEIVTVDFPRSLLSPDFVEWSKDPRFIYAERVDKNDYAFKSKRISWAIRNRKHGYA